MPVYGAVAAIDVRTVAALEGAESPDDAFELVKERRLDQFDLGERWHAVHWLLARCAGPGAEDPASWAVLGRSILRPIDRGLGPPGLVEPPHVAAVASALSALEPKAARRRYDAEAMDRAGIHPGTWRRGGVARPHLLVADLGPLAAFYRRARKAGAGTVGFRY